MYVITVDGEIQEDYGAFLVESEAKLVAEGLQDELTELWKAGSFWATQPWVLVWQLNLHGAGGHWLLPRTQPEGPRWEPGHTVPADE